MHIDLGTGDGQYLLRRARLEPERDFLGIEPNHAGMIAASRQGAKLANAAFALGSLHELPGPFCGTATSLSILFPWGSLLRAVLEAEASALEAIKATCVPGGHVEVVTALDAADEGELARLGVGTFDFERTGERWWEAGFRDVELATLDADHPYQTTWWKKIRQRPGRHPLLLKARTPGC